MSKCIYVYTVKSTDLPWIKEAVLTFNKDLFEYKWVEAFVSTCNTCIAFHTATAHIEGTSHPYWEEAIHLGTAEEFKEKLCENLLTT